MGRNGNGSNPWDLIRLRLDQGEESSLLLLARICLTLTRQIEVDLR